MHGSLGDRRAAKREERVGAQSIPKSRDPPLRAIVLKRPPNWMTIVTIAAPGFATPSNLA